MSVLPPRFEVSISHQCKLPSSAEIAMEVVCSGEGLLQPCDEQHGLATVHSSIGDFLLYCSDPDLVRLDLGSTVSARVKHRRGWRGWSTSGVVHDAEGGLIFAIAVDGDPSWARPWAVVVTDDYTEKQDRSLSHRVAFSLGTSTVNGSDQEWSTAVVDDQLWAVRAHACRWPPGPRPADAQDYLRYSIARLRG